jgi:outer membrane protein assembly factor BamE (lipoprotein component of BamABCDE complex)
MRKLVPPILACVFLFACARVQGVFRTVEGASFDLAAMEQVQTGMTIEEVNALVGSPFGVTGEGDAVIHRYYMVREKTDTDRAVGVFPVKKKTTEMYEVILTYENSVLVRKKLTRSVEKPKEKEPK